MTIHIDHKNNRITTGQDADKSGLRLTIDNTGSLTLPKGTTSQRPPTPVSGDFRFNEDSGVLEYYDGTQWRTLLSLVSGGSLSYEDLVDSNGNMILDGISIGSAFANYGFVQNASAGSPVRFGATGSDPDVDLSIETKGSGKIYLGNAGGVLYVFNGSGASSLEFRSDIAVNISAATDLRIAARDVSLNATSAVNFISRTTQIVVGTGSYFKIQTSSYPLLTIRPSGPSGISVETGNSDTKIWVSGTLMVTTTLGDFVVTDGVTEGLRVVSNTPGHGVTISASPSATNFETEELFVFTNVSGPIIADFGIKRVTNVDDPVNLYDAVNKRYVENILASVRWKESVRVATTGNITLAGLTTVDGVALVSGDRVLVKNQTVAQDNGIYIAAAGPWSRSPDADTNAEVQQGMAVFVEDGTVNKSTAWILTTNPPIILGTTPLTFVQFVGPQVINLEGHEGVSVLLSGNVWQIYADTDEQTITRGTLPTDVLSVYAGPGVVPGNVLQAPAATPGIAQWGPVDLSNPNSVQNVLPVQYGGTGLSAIPAESLLVGTGTNRLRILPPGTSKQFLRIRVSGGSPEVAWLSAGLVDMVDVSLSALTSGQLLVYSSSTGVWENRYISTLITGEVKIDATDAKGYLADKVQGITPIEVYVSSGTSKTLNISLSSYPSHFIVVSGALAVGGGAQNQILVAQGGGLPAQWEYLSTLRDGVTGNVVLSAGNATVPGPLITLSGTPSTAYIKASTSSLRIISPVLRLNGLTIPASGKPFSLLGTQAVSGQLTFISVPSGTVDQVLVYDSTTSSLTFVSAANVQKSISTYDATTLVDSDTSILRFGEGLTPTLVAPGDVKIDIDISSLPYNIPDYLDEFVFFDVTTATHKKCRYQDLIPSGTFLGKYFITSSMTWTPPLPARTLVIRAVGGGGGGAGGNSTLVSSQPGTPGSNTVIDDADTGGTLVHVVCSGGLPGDPTGNKVFQRGGSFSGSNIKSGVVLHGSGGGASYMYVGGNGGDSPLGMGGGMGGRRSNGDTPTGYGAGGGGGGPSGGTLLNGGGGGGPGGGVDVTVSLSGVTSLTITVGTGGTGGIGDGSGGNGASGIVIIEAYT